MDPPKPDHEPICLPFPSPIVPLNPVSAQTACAHITTVADALSELIPADSKRSFSIDAHSIHLAAQQRIWDGLAAIALFSIESVEKKRAYASIWSTVAAGTEELRPAAKGDQAAVYRLQLTKGQISILRSDCNQFVSGC